MVRDLVRHDHADSGLLMELRGARWQWLVGGLVAAMLVTTGIFVFSRGDDATAPPTATGSTDPAVTPAPELAAERPASGMTVTLTRFTPGPPIATIEQPVSMFVQVSGIAPVTAVELWAGSDRVDVIEDTTRLDPTWSVKLTWKPSVEGTMLLAARGRDADGRSVTSNLVTFTTAPQSAPLPIVQYETVEGDTPSSVAARFGVGAEALLAGAFDSDLAYEVGTTIGIPQALDDVPPDDVDQPAPSGFRSARPAVPVNVPIAEIAGCRVAIEVPFTNATDAVLVRAAVGASGFEPVETSPRSGAGKISFDEIPLAPGPQLFAIEATTGAIRTSSAPMLVSGSDGCGGTWDGDLRIEHGALLGVPDDISQVFLFVGTGGAWRRVPSEDQTTLRRAGGGFDVRGTLPDLADASTVEIEVWGWREGALVDLGRSRFIPDDGFDPTLALGRGRGSSLALITSPDGVVPEVLSIDEWLSDAGVQRFRWSSSIPGTTHAVWQILTFAAPPGTSPMTSGVVAQGQLAGSNGTFELDIQAIIDGPPQTPELTSTMPAYASIAGPAAETVGRTKEALPPGDAQQAGGASPLSAQQTTDLLFPPLDDIHIRVIPMVGEHWPGTATTNVVIHLGDPSFNDLTKNLDLDGLGDPIDPDATPYELTATILPPTPPNPGYVNCWQFVKWDVAQRNLNFFKADQYQWWDDFLAAIGPSTPICPGPCYFDSIKFGGGKPCKSGGVYIPGLSELGTFAVQLWDALVAGLSAIKGWVVDAIVQVSGCTAFASKAFCDGVATLAVNAVLAAYGIPPSLPDSEQLKQIAKGELKELVLESAQDLGIPCAELGTASNAIGADEISCDTLIDAALDEVERTVGEFFAESARASAGIPFPPGAIVQPAQQGQTGPAIVTMTLTPTTGAPTVGGMECTAQITMLSSWSPPEPGVPFAQVLGAAGALQGGSPVRLPNYQTGRGSDWTFMDTWAVPKRKYDGFIAIQRVDLPTRGLAYSTTAPAAPVSRTYFPALWYSDPVEGTLLVKSPSSSKPQWHASYWANLPYHALQLHGGAKFVAEIYSPCTGLYRYENPILGLFFKNTVGTFTKVS